MPVGAIVPVITVILEAGYLIFTDIRLGDMRLLPHVPIVGLHDIVEGVAAGHVGV